MCHNIAHTHFIKAYARSEEDLEQLTARTLQEWRATPRVRCGVPYSRCLPACGRTPRWHRRAPALHRVRQVGRLDYAYLAHLCTSRNTGAITIVLQVDLGVAPCQSDDSSEWPTKPARAVRIRQ
eukprot:1023014-Pyramimonas_sp.AAC.1